MFRVAKEATFAAAHHLRHYEGRCENMHGHNWRVQVVVEGQQLGDDGILVDFNVLKRSLNDVLDQLDHHDLNTLTPFLTAEPSAENIARFIASEMGHRLNTPHARVCQVNVWETEHSLASYDVEPE